MLDVVHVTEYLWRAAYAFRAEGSSNEAERRVMLALLALFQGPSGGQVAKSLRAMIRGPALDIEGLPIATGVIEGVPVAMA